MKNGVLVALASLALSLQQPSQGRAAFILGRVVDAITGRPVDGATVTLSLSGNRTSVPKPLVPATGLTDDQGRFLFRNLSKGRYSVSVTAAGYLDAAYGQRQPGGVSRLIALEEDQALGDIDVRIWKAASIAGTIIDDQDRVVVGISVSLLRADGRGGRVRLSESEFGGRYSVQTNDRGDFDFSRLGPGDYVVVVPEHMASAPSSLVPNRNTGSGYTTTFHPGASRPEDAAIVSLVPGDRRAGIDLRLRRSSTYTLSGTLLGPEGPLAKSQVYLIPTYATGTPLEKTHFAAMAMNPLAARVVPVSQSATYFIDDLPAGAYLVAAMSDEQASLWRQPATIQSLAAGASRINLQRGGITVQDLRTRR